MPEAVEDFYNKDSTSQIHSLKYTEATPEILRTDMQNHIFNNFETSQKFKTLNEDQFQNNFNIEPPVFITHHSHHRHHHRRHFSKDFETTQQNINDHLQRYNGKDV